MELRIPAVCGVYTDDTLNFLERDVAGILRTPCPEVRFSYVEVESRWKWVTGGLAGTVLHHGCDLDLVLHLENGVSAVPASHEVPAGQGPSIIDDADEPCVSALVDDVEQNCKILLQIQSDIH
jgi:hypothetical protein